MREVMDTALPLVGPLLVALPLVMWARYFLIKYGEDEVPRLRVPLVWTGVVALVVVVVAVLEEPVV